jgi:hypothetical protein
MPDNVLELNDDVHVIIGTRTSRRQTNWRYRYDALSQVNQAYRNNILSSQESQCHAIKLSMISITTICIKIHHINRISSNNIDIPFVDRPKKALMLLFIFLMYQLLSAQATDEEINNLINIYEHERVTVNFPEAKNTVINELSEENSYLRTRFTKEQHTLLLVHLQIPNIVRPQVSGDRIIFTG